MNLTSKSFIALSTAIACVSGSVAFADGPGSKDKSRMPLAAGEVITIGAHSQPAPSFFTSKKVRDQMKISAWIRHNLAAQKRAAEAPKTKADRAHWVHENTDYVNPQMKIDRLRLVTRGMGAQPIECERLHTHERAVCQRDAQLRRTTERVQLALRK